MNTLFKNVGRRIALVLALVLTITSVPTNAIVAQAEDASTKVYIGWTSSTVGAVGAAAGMGNKDDSTQSAAKTYDLGDKCGENPIFQIVVTSKTGDAATRQSVNGMMVRNDKGYYLVNIPSDADKAVLKYKASCKDTKYKDPTYDVTIDGVTETKALPNADYEEFTIELNGKAGKTVKLQGKNCDKYKAADYAEIDQANRTNYLYISDISLEVEVAPEGDPEDPEVSENKVTTIVDTVSAEYTVSDNKFTVSANDAQKARVNELNKMILNWTVSGNDLTADNATIEDGATIDVTSDMTISANLVDKDAKLFTISCNGLVSVNNLLKNYTAGQKITGTATAGAGKYITAVKVANKTVSSNEMPKDVETQGATFEYTIDEADADEEGVITITAEEAAIDYFVKVNVTGEKDHVKFEYDATKAYHVGDKDIAVKMTVDEGYNAAASVSLMKDSDKAANKFAESGLSPDKDGYLTYKYDGTNPEKLRFQQNKDMVINVKAQKDAEPVAIPDTAWRLSNQFESTEKGTVALKGGTTYGNTKIQVKPLEDQTVKTIDTPVKVNNVTYSFYVQGEDGKKAKDAAGTEVKKVGWPTQGNAYNVKSFAKGKLYIIAYIPSAKNFWIVKKNADETLTGIAPYDSTTTNKISGNQTIILDVDEEEEYEIWVSGGNIMLLDMAFAAEGDSGNGGNGGNGGTVSANCAEHEEFTVDFADPAAAEVPFSGAKYTPEVVVECSKCGAALTLGTDYTVSYKDNTGKIDKDITATVTVKGKGNYSFAETLSFKILQPEVDGFESVKGCKIEVAKAVDFTGAAVEPEIKVTNKGAEVESGKYGVVYANNVNAGTATVAIFGAKVNGKATTVKKTFKINPVQVNPKKSTTAMLNLESKDIVGEDAEAEFTASGAVVSINELTYEGYDLVAGKDFTYKFANNKKITTSAKPAKVTLTFKGNFKGKAEAVYQIVGTSEVQAFANTVTDGAKLGKANVFVFDADGNQLKVNKDFAIEYEDGVDANTAAKAGETYTVTIKKYTGKGATNTLDESVSEVLTITGISKDDAKKNTIKKVDTKKTQKAYTGSKVELDKEKEISVEIGNKATTEDYELVYAKNINKGSATVYAIGKDSVAGMKKASFKIVPRNKIK